MDSPPEALLTCQEVKCEINLYKQPRYTFFHPKSANQRGASKTSLLALLTNNLSISALAAHSLFLLLSFFLSSFLVPSFSSTPLLMEDHNGEYPLFSQQAP